jgi:transcriptional regulator GlxA family with amidase domain
LLRHASRLLDDPHIRVAGIADQLGISDRHLRRLFDQAIGLAPKRYATVSRLHRVLRLAGAAPSPDGPSSRSTQVTATRPT